METVSEALTNGHISLNAASLPSPLRKYACTRYLDRKSYFFVEKIRFIVEGELFNIFAVGTIRVLYKHPLFTKSGF